MATFFMIMLFATAGFEHCVANMYYISAGLIAKTNPLYVELALQNYSLNTQQIADLNVKHFLINNLLPVTIGNIIGGILIGIVFYYLNRGSIEEAKEIDAKDNKVIFGYKKLFN